MTTTLAKQIAKAGTRSRWEWNQNDKGSDGIESWESLLHSTTREISHSRMLWSSMEGRTGLMQIWKTIAPLVWNLWLNGGLGLKLCGGHAQNMGVPKGVGGGFLGSCSAGLWATKQWFKVFFDKLTFVTNSAVFEDNNAALTLTTDKNATPWNGHIEAKCHWFRSHVVDTFEIKKTDTNKQVADYLTNDIEADKFANARMMMCGWWLFALFSKIVWN